uniref:Uncharacterized protein n=1 Tax=Leptobrachium leishanense TaxID=445787 RepID=A0A8C5PQE5_9ANUR
MASAALRDELTCCICMDIYRDPVTLPCGHSFCRLCIVGVLDTQEESGAYKCPECRAESQERPALEKNRKLGNIAKRFLYAHPDQEEAGIPCTYCIQSPVPAVKTCLLCEASLCEDHLRVHSKSAEHVITEPTMSLEKRKCIADMKDPQYYCLDDAACICVSCSLAGEHRGHQVETLNEASEKKKKKLRNILKKLKSKRKEAETKVQNLQEIRKEVQEKAAGVTERVTALIRGLIRQLEALEKRVLSEISRQEEHAAFICTSCKPTGQHRRHQVETLHRASQRKKETLRDILRKFTSEKTEAERKEKSLQRLKRQVHGKAAGVTERVTALIRGIIRQLEALEKRVLSEISRQEEQVSLRVSDLIRQLEIKKEELSRKMGDIEKLCDMEDPVTVLQEKESDRDDYCDMERCAIKVQDVGDLDVGLISVTLREGLINIVAGTNRQLHIPEASDVFLDVNMVSDMFLDVKTAGNYVSVSGDLTTVSWPQKNQCRPQTAERFKDFPQVLSSRSFSSGRHYWDVENSEPAGWKVGMAYPSMDRRGRQSEIGNNSKSWAVGRWSNNDYYAITGSKLVSLSPHPTCQRLGIFLDYEAGRLSFYELCDPIRHLHTFTAAFTEPLHAVFGVYGSKTWLRV